MEKTVLVVDPAEGDREGLARKLGAAGYRVYAASAGHEALEMLPAVLPDLLILELALPDMDGLTLLRQAKDSFPEKFLPVLICTAASDARSRLIALESGADDYVVKGGEFEDLAGRLKVLLRFKDFTDGLRLKMVSFITKAEELKFALSTEQKLLREIQARGDQQGGGLITDPLTGAYNAGHFKERLRFHFQLGKRYHQALTLIHLDLDRFRSVPGGGEGAASGAAIRQFAAIVQETVRDVDIVARTGPDEISLVLPNTDGSDAFKLAQRLRGKLAAHEFQGMSRPVKLTVSAGVAALESRMEQETEMESAAAQALARAKKMGGNTVVMGGAGDAGLEEGPLDRLLNVLDHRIREFSVEATNKFAILGSELIRGIEKAQLYGHDHSGRTGDLARGLARSCGLPPGAVEAVRRAGLLHDLGLLIVPTGVLAKRGPLTPEEWALVRTHPQVGARLLANYRLLEDEIPMIHHHHERFDGKGYPDGLKGNEIPIGARILNICEAYETLTGGRPYCPGIPREEALKEIERQAGAQFDPRLVKFFSPGAAGEG